MIPRICTGIVTYNRLELLKGAIESIKSQKQPTDILIVNNGSTDGTKEYLDNLHGIIVINQGNVGGAGGFFTALKYIAEHGYEFAWVMDDDIIAQRDTLSTLVEAYKDLSLTENIGFLCSTVLSPEKFTVNVPTISTTTNSTGYPEWNKFLHKGIVKVQTATFVSVFLSTDIIHQVGLPIKDYFIWGDDTEYTQRISHIYPSYLIGKSIIQHLRNGGLLDLKQINDPLRIKMFRYFIRNNLYNQRKYGTTKSTILFIYENFKIFTWFLFHGYFQKAGVILRGIMNGVFFCPKIQYPEI